MYRKSTVVGNGRTEGEVRFTNLRCTIYLKIEKDVRFLEKRAMIFDYYQDFFERTAMPYYHKLAIKPLAYRESREKRLGNKKSGCRRDVGSLMYAETFIKTLIETVV